MLLSNGDLMLRATESDDEQTYECLVHLEGNITIRYRSYQVDITEGRIGILQLHVFQ